MRYLITFFLRLGIRSKRTLGMLLLGLIPVGLALLLKQMNPSLEGEGVAVFELFPQLGFTLYLHFLVPLTALFLGAGVIADEVSERTLPYLLSRPIPRRNIVIAKVAAAMITSAVILTVSLFLSYAVLTTGGGGAFARNLDQFTSAAAAVLLGMAAYLGFFTLIGGITTRAVLVGLVFIFGWENSVAFVPAKVRYLTIAHYLHVMSPPPAPDPANEPLRAFLNIVLPQQQMSAGLAVTVLVVLAVVFTAAASQMLLLKEYRMQQSV